MLRHPPFFPVCTAICRRIPGACCNVCLLHLENNAVIGASALLTSGLKRNDNISRAICRSNCLVIPQNVKETVVLKLVLKEAGFARAIGDTLSFHVEETGRNKRTSLLHKLRCATSCDFPVTVWQLCPPRTFRKLYQNLQMRFTCPKAMFVVK